MGQTGKARLTRSSERRVGGEFRAFRLDMLGLAHQEIGDRFLEAAIGDPVAL